MIGLYDSRRRQEGRPIQRSLSEATRQRFQKLLRLAAESPYAGERANALSAARRLAANHGLSLNEAARAGFDARPEAKPETRRNGHRPHSDQTRADRRAWNPAYDLARFFHLSEAHIQAEKARRDASMRAARERGLDAEEIAAEKRRREREHRRVWRSGARRNPYSHARVLLSETSIPFAEIAAVTGLDIYQVVGMKLKMRGT